MVAVIVGVDVLFLRHHTWPRLAVNIAIVVRGLRTDRTAQVVIAGLAFVQNLCRGHYELATETPHPLRIAAAFTELAMAI